MDLAYLLVHSPLVGPFTWSPVADALRDRGLEAIVPVLADSEASPVPYWQQHAESVARPVAEVSEARPLVFVGHSGAGQLLPAIRQVLRRPAAAYVFVDAGLPEDGRSRLAQLVEE